MSGADVASVNTAPEPEAAAILAPLFEGAPRFLHRLLAARPFGSWDALFERARAIAHAMPEVEQIELIDAHPRLGAAPGTVSRHSFHEQGYDTGRPVEVDVATELERLNDAYEARHGFRCCVYVAGRSREALLPEMATFLEGERTGELHRALDAVVDIAVARHAAGAPTPAASAAATRA